MRLNRVLQFLKASPFLIILGISTPTSVLMPGTRKFLELNGHTQALSTVQTELLPLPPSVKDPPFSFLLVTELTSCPALDARVTVEI